MKVIYFGKNNTQPFNHPLSAYRNARSTLSNEEKINGFKVFFGNRTADYKRYANQVKQNNKY